MATMDATRAEFAALQWKVQEIEVNAVSVGEQFEKFQDDHTAVKSQVEMHEDYNKEHSENIKRLEAVIVGSTLQDVVNEIRKFEALNIETTLKELKDSLTSVQLQVTNHKAEFDNLELKEMGDKVEELRSQAKPQPTEATAELMREPEEKVFASTVKSLSKLESAFEVVKLQVTENIGLNDEKFKKIDEQMTKGRATGRGGLLTARLSTRRYPSSPAPRASQRFAVSCSSSGSFCRRTTITLR